jgi:hypothetical protein
VSLGFLFPEMPPVSLNFIADLKFIFNTGALKAEQSAGRDQRAD